MEELMRKLHAKYRERAKQQGGKQDDTKDNREEEEEEEEEKEMDQKKTRPCKRGGGEKGGSKEGKESSGLEEQSNISGRLRRVDPVVALAAKKKAELRLLQADKRLQAARRLDPVSAWVPPKVRVCVCVCVCGELVLVVANVCGLVGLWQM
jgi:hypothetical protein